MTKQKQRIWLICSLCIVLIGTLTGYVYIHRKQSNIEDAWNTYTQALTQQNYEQMYQLLSHQAKQHIDQPTFVKEYQNSYQKIQALDLHITTKDIIKQGHTHVAAYHIEMNSLAGKIAFDQTMEIVKEDKTYKMNWTYGQIFPQMKQGDQIQIERKSAKRGSILDRNDHILAQDGSTTTIGIVPGKLTNKETLSTLSHRLNIPSSSIEHALKATWVTDDVFVPIKTISKDQTIDIQDLSGVVTRSSTSRIYPYHETCAHLTGYVQAINQEEYQKHQKEGYTIDSLIGKTGLELVYEKELKGQDGIRIQLIRNHNLIQEIANKPVQDGTNIKTTIDINLQTKLYNLLKNESGAGVVLQPFSGEVLAMVSTPAYDPNDFSLGMTSSKWDIISNHPNKPLENKCIQSYTPGSTFKPITAAIALDTQTITPTQDLQPAINKQWQQDASWGNYFVKTTTAYSGPANLENALIYSDNTYFAKAALQIGPSSFLKKLQSYGFHEQLQFPFHVKKSTVQDLDHSITLADTGYGQGKLQISPLHLTALYSAIINQGDLPQPYLLYDGGNINIWKSDIIQSETAKILTEDLIKSYTQFEKNPKQAGGKTGTAQVNNQELGWLCCINKDYAITLMVEHTEDKGGSKYVVPMMQQLWDLL